MPLSALALMAGILLGRASDEALLGAALLAAAAMLAAFSRGRERRAAFLLAVMAVGFLRGCAAYHPDLPREGTYTVTGVVADEVRFRDYGHARTVLRRVTLDGEPIAGGAYWTGYSDALPESLVPGASVSFTARVYQPDERDNPGGFDFQEYLLQRNITVGVYGMDDVLVTGSRFTLSGWAARARHSLSEGLVRAMGEEAGGYAAAMLLGNRELIPSEDRAAFSRLGIAHILSVSGYHVGVLAGLLSMLFRRLRLRQGLRTAVTALILATYCLLTGMNAPVVRASVLVVLYQMGRLQHRQNIGLHLLSASAVMMLLISPAQLTGASFQLSYAAMLGLLLVLPALERLPFVRKRKCKRLCRAVCAAFAAQLGILLPQVYWFQELPLLALPLNVVILAGAGLLMSLYWLVLALLALQPVAAVVGALAGAITEGLLSVIRALGGVDGISLWVRQANGLTLIAWVALMATMSILWTWRRSLPVLLSTMLMVLSLIPWPYAGASYMQFSVGNADAALLRDRDMVVVVDAGEDGEALATYLKQQRLSVDLLVLTHLHSDHAGGIRALLDNRIPVTEVAVPEGAMDAAIDPEMVSLLDELLDTGAALRVLARGDTVGLPDGVMTVVWPEPGKVRAGMDANLHSLVMHVELRGTTMLLTGDLDGDYERYAAVPADILKVAHHGSSASTSEAFLEAVNPQTLLLSCGDDARQQAMEQRRGDIQLYGTQEHGAIMIEFADNGYTVRTMR